MKIRELAISGAWEFTPIQHGDSRGVFLEAYQAPLLAEVASPEVQQQWLPSVVAGEAIDDSSQPMDPS